MPINVAPWPAEGQVKRIENTWFVLETSSEDYNELGWVLNSIDNVGKSYFSVIFLNIIILCFLECNFN